MVLFDENSVKKNKNWRLNLNPFKQGMSTSHPKSPTYPAAPEGAHMPGPGHLILLLLTQVIAGKYNY